jgi:putative oxygen-independent coproporphyrinogen III oxidase
MTPKHPSETRCATDRIADSVPAAPSDALLPPLSLYVHIPWCVRKCPYCDFNSHPLRGTLPEQAYVQALLADLDCRLPVFKGRTVGSIFFGGGTPSLFSASTINQLLTAFRSRIHCSPDVEITLEANPGTVEADRLDGFAQAGVNRLSLGVQSFDDAQLTTLGRIHDGHEARRALDSACKAFARVNVDLMFGLPGQRAVASHNDVSCALDSGATHISAYLLTIEAHTAFARKAPTLPNDDQAADLQESLIRSLTQAGLTRYEVSAYARPGQMCRHNVNYWAFGDYVGLGAGAHSKLSSRDAHGLHIMRSAQWKHPASYMNALSQGQAAGRTHSVSTADLPVEFMMNALRLREGFAPDLFCARTGLPLSTIEAALDQAQADGLLERTQGCIRATAQGYRLLNRLLGYFLPDA